MAEGQGPMVRMEAVIKRRGQADGGFELRVPELRIQAGEVVGLIGESGCGKSTLLDLIALILAPSSAGRFTLYLPGEGARQDLAALWSRGDEGALAALRREALGYIPQTGGCCRCPGRARLIPALAVAHLLDILPGLQAGEDVKHFKSSAKTLLTAKDINGVLNFTRPLGAVTQVYRGTLSADGVQGTFTQGGTPRTYDWSGKRLAGETPCRDDTTPDPESKPESGPTSGPTKPTDNSGTMSGWSVDIGDVVESASGEISTSSPSDGVTSYYRALASLLGDWSGFSWLSFDKKSSGGSYANPDEYGADGDVVIENPHGTARFSISNPITAATGVPIGRKTRNRADAASRASRPSRQMRQRTPCHQDSSVNGTPTEDECGWSLIRTHRMPSEESTRMTAGVSPADSPRMDAASQAHGPSHRPMRRPETPDG